MLRIFIDGGWETNEFGELLRCVAFLYRVSAAAEFGEVGEEGARLFNTEAALRNAVEAFRSNLPPNREWFGPTRMRWVGSPTGILRISRIQYGSPGFTDFTGIGTALEKVCEFIKYLIELSANAATRRLQEELLEQDVEAKKIENSAKRIQNAAKLLELAQATGCSPELQRSVLFSIQEAQQSLIELAENGQIVRAEEVEENQPAI
jgi:hypothetical protein